MLDPSRSLLPRSYKDDDTTTREMASVSYTSDVLYASSDTYALVILLQLYQIYPTHHLQGFIQDILLEGGTIDHSFGNSGGESQPQYETLICHIVTSLPDIPHPL